MNSSSARSRTFRPPSRSSPRTGGADPVDVPEGNVDPLVTGKVGACDPSHCPVLLTLTLLVPGVLGADDHDPAVPPDQLAPVAHLLHRRTHFHVERPTPPGPPNDIGRRSVPASDRTVTAPPGPDPRGGF